MDRNVYFCDVRMEHTEYEQRRAMGSAMLFGNDEFYSMDID